ncbi:MAG: histidinol phosphate phosphatase domain-containing protein [Candidatus Ranarchaeia archaeon]
MHSFFSDGELLPSEIVRRVTAKNHKAIAITDHADLSNIDLLLNQLNRIANEINQTLQGFKLLTGVELTHVHPSRIHHAAKLARKKGAQIIIVHGETPVEPVMYGTNQAAIESSEVDILAHPGILSPEQVKMGRDRGLYFELSARKGHCLGNGLVARLCERYGAKMLVNSDAHSPNDFLNRKLAERIILGAGLPKKWVVTILEKMPQELLQNKTKIE